jgi:hypothetical protein
MAAKTLEERVKLLEEINEKQSRRIQRLEDVHEIANMMGRYVYQHEQQRDPEFYDTMFAKKTPGVSWEVAHMGVFKGREGIKRALDAHGPKGDKPAPGTLFIHTLTSPVIEVAGDGKTAKGIWTSPGAETVGEMKNGKPRGFWAWTKYGCDFVREDGRWRIWHYHVYRIFMTPSDTDYGEEYEMKVLDAPGSEAGPGSMRMQPDGPPTYDNPYCSTYIPEGIPAPPEPYETFDLATSYGPPED